MALFDWIPRFDPRKALPSSTGTSGTPVVLLHGAYSTPKAFGALAVALNEIGRPFIAPDYAHYGTGAFVDGLRDVTAICEGFRSFDIVGHSFGGIIGLQLLRQPEFVGKVSTIMVWARRGRGCRRRGSIW